MVYSLMVWAIPNVDIRTGSSPHILILAYPLIHDKQGLDESNSSLIRPKGPFEFYTSIGIIVA